MSCECGQCQGVIFVMVVGVKDEDDVFECDDQYQCLDDD